MVENTSGQIDLHTHSTASDGLLSPTALVQRAASLGIAVLALTDHDSVAGIDEACSAANRLQVACVPGVELSTDWPGGECHILGYFLDHRLPALQRVLEEFQRARRERGRRMVERLQALGLDISWRQVRKLAGSGSVTRSHIAEALVEAGCVASRQEAFDRYIGRGKPADVLRYKLTPEEAVALIRQARGVPVLAHPTFVEPERDWDADPLFPWPFLERLIAAGLLGLEAYYGEYSPDLSARLAALANFYGLIATGGSDFHGNGQGPALGAAPVPPDTLDHLYRLAQQMHSPWAPQETESGEP